jgi:Tol biopolymer transport system component
MRLQIVTPPTSAPLHFALSPDGRFIVFVASESTDKRGRLYLRALDKTEAEPMSGTDEARYPFWSADSRSVGFFASGMLYRIDITGGPPQALTTAQAAQGGTWNEDGTILFAPNTVSAILRVSASGGEATAATRLDSPRQSGHRHPSFLPGGRQFLYYTQGEPQVSGIYLGSLDGQAPKRLTDADTAGEYLAPDHVVFVRQGALVARRLDAGRGELIGDPVPLSPSVGTDGTFRGGFSASASGILGHRTGGGNRAELTWFDRMGNVLGGAGDGNGPELSPDGRRIAFDRVVDGNRDVWVNDLVRGGLTRFTFNVAVDGYPLWSPDGSQVAFESNRNGTFDLFVRPSNGSAAEQLLLESSADSEWPLHWSKDGRYLLYQISDLKTREDLSALPMTGSDRTPIVVANSAFAERMGEFSPDGRWVAYETNESGRPEIIAQAFPEPKGTWPVSTGGGTAPRWSADGGEIYFVAPDGNIMAAPVTTKGSTLEAGKPLLLFSTQIVRQAFKAQYTVSRDGRFLVNNLSAEQVPASPVTLIVNWQP